MTQSELDDETLMSYADGELEGPSARRVELAMAADPRVAVRIVAFQRTRRMVRAAYAASPQTVPDTLRAAVEADVRAHAAAPIRDAPPSPGLQPKRRWRGVLRPALAVAAALAAVLVGYGAGQTTRTPPPSAINLAALDDVRLPGALSHSPSGQTVPLAGGTLRIVQSFQRGDGVLCREFALETTERSTSAVACRPGRTWEIGFAANAPQIRADGYVPAGAPEALDAWLASIQAGEMLDPKAEASALTR